jgi:hypothetical protein
MFRLVSACFSLFSLTEYYWISRNRSAFPPAEPAQKQEPWIQYDALWIGDRSSDPLFLLARKQVEELDCTELLKLWRGLRYSICMHFGFRGSMMWPLVSFSILSKFYYAKRRFPVTSKCR